MNAGQFFAEYWSVILSAVLTVASLIIAYIQTKKTGNKKGLLTLFAKIPTLVTEAEKIFGSGNGQAKLNYVLTELRVYAIENNIKADTDDLKAQVESVVTTTKNVNVDATPTAEVETVQSDTGESDTDFESGTDNSQIDVNI